MVKPSQRKQLAQEAVEKRVISIRVSCKLFAIGETAYRYKTKLQDENTRIADWLLCITQNQRNWGFGLCFLYLRNVKGFAWNGNPPIFNRNQK